MKYFYRDNREIIDDWIVVPLGFAAAVHFLFWAVFAFISWDLAVLSLFGHRLMFAIIAGVIYAALIDDAIGGDG